MLPKIVLCSGKGGVGKTTITAALACARARSGKKVLIISIDPAHSLGDSLKMDLSDNKVHAVPGFGTLHALELKIAIGSKNKGAGNDLGSQSDDGSLEQLLGGIFFPVSEEMSILESLVYVSRLLFGRNNSGVSGESRLDIDELYIDGSPSGHMLRALSFPFQMNEYLERLIRVYSKFKRIIELSPRKRDLLRKKEDLMESFKRIVAILRNPGISTMVLVMIPEAMALSETQRTYQQLQGLGINVTNLIINKIQGDGTRDRIACPFCAERVKHESEIISQTTAQFNTLSITELPLFETEITGTDRLLSLQPFLLNQKP
nr:ArsA family ATPase [Candidatus Sigynarchaeota archaeon]